MHLSGNFSADLQRFAADLRDLRARSGMPSYRAVARAAHYSHTAISEAARGRELPSLPVTLAFVSVCGGDVEQWERDWRLLSEEVHRQQAGAGATDFPSSPWPTRPVADGVDPEEADCARDAVTVHSRRIAFDGRPTIVGQIELRYSGRVHAAWGRFEGYGFLDYLAMKGADVQIIVDAVREPDNTRTSFRYPYSFDYHWSEVVVTGRGLFYACATVVVDGERSAYGETDRFELA